MSFSRNIHAIRPEDIELGLIDWSLLYVASHVDEMVSHFTASLIEIFDRLAPIICRRVSHPLTPWLNGAIRRLIELKKCVLLWYRRSQPPADW